MTYTVIDLVNSEPYPALTVQDVQSAVYYILDGESDPYTDRQLTKLLSDVDKYGSAFSHHLGLEVVSHE